MLIDFEKIFEQKFFARPTLEVAPDLLGARLCRRHIDGRITYAAIIEVEAYTSNDPACHAFRGETNRCRVMFGPPGYSYVYFIYGMYNCLNVVTEPAGTAAAVLIRALDLDGANGPGKLCKTLEIDRSHNAINLMDPTGELWLVHGDKLKKHEIGKSIRVGISHAQERLWRFFVKDHPGLSVRNVKMRSKNKKSQRAIEKEEKKRRNRKA